MMKAADAELETKMCFHAGMPRTCVCDYSPLILCLCRT